MVKKIKIGKNEFEINQGLLKISNVTEDDMIKAPWNYYVNDITEIIITSELKSLYGLEQLSNLRKLTAFNCGISDISSLEYCTKLEELILPHNYIQKIRDLANHKSLRILNLNSNFITDFEILSTIPHLEHVSLQYNKIPENIVFKSKSLLYLDLELNSFEKPPDFSNIVQLKTLKMDNTHISKMSGLNMLTNLEILSLNSNNITKIEGLDSQTKLRCLFLSENKISSIEGLQNCINLQKVTLENNPLPQNLLALTPWDMVSLCGGKPNAAIQPLKDKRVLLPELKNYYILLDRLLKYNAIHRCLYCGKAILPGDDCLVRCQKRLIQTIAIATKDVPITAKGKLSDIDIGPKRTTETYLPGGTIVKKSTRDVTFVRNDRIVDSVDVRHIILSPEGSLCSSCMEQFLTQSSAIFREIDSRSNVASFIEASQDKAYKKHLKLLEEWVINALKRKEAM